MPLQAKALEALDQLAPSQNPILFPNLHLHPRQKVAAQASVARALKGVNDEIAQLMNPDGPNASDGTDTGSGTSGGSSGGSADSGAGTVSPDVQEMIDQLKTQLAKALLAVSIQGAQTQIIGSFAKGTLHVPQTGLALVHAGEQIRTAAQVSSSSGLHGGWDGSLPNINVVLEGDDAGFSRYIRVKAVEAASEISDRIGRSANLRVRGGQFQQLSGRR